MPTTFLDKVKSTIRKYDMLRKHDRLLVGLSGGPDSVVLLHILLMLKQEYLLDIYIAHLDHKFRGEESAADRKFCEELARGLKLDIGCEEIDVPSIAREQKISPEEAARQVRYDFFGRLAAARGIKKIAVAHTKDDQAETVLMRAIRGAGMSGLGGMRAVKEMHGFMIIRPLIEISRREVEGFIKAHDLRFRHDSTNDKLIFTRNRIRKELIPYLEDKFNPNIKEVLANMADTLSVEDEFLDRFAKRKLRAMSKKDSSGGIIIDIKKLGRQEEAVKRRILRCALRELKGNLRRFTYRHWKEMDELIDKRPGNSIVDFPGGINFRKDKNKLVIYNEED